MSAESHGPRGFTLIEMMVVVTMLSTLAMVALPLAEVASARKKERELRESLWKLREAIDAYKRAVDEGVIASPNQSGYPPSLAVLTDGVPDAHASGATRYFLRRLPRDPFAPPNVPDALTWGLRSFESPGDNPREGTDVYDVYSRSGRIGTNGVPLRNW